ncbi:PREDICTED: 5-hydroxytryptamine receptor 1-like [Nicrophorus vespilloides]|uniref:5-hydroxytryptamine receptor 1-like n=1 Tax=Nicrophorus vespilloides TaxID=110193 RepID=A0ABM1MJX8_NICVS|nr:PREDICTED: 5-hydroxytryptamine receptor 1-like [Nicrophorus vespilloides]
MEKSSLGRCFATRKSNESQCPMIKTSAATGTTPMKQLSTRPSSKAASTKTSPSINNTQKKLRFQLAKERKASTTLGIIMSAFTFCWLPFFVLALIRPFLDQSSTAVNTLSSLFLWLGYANSLLNPIIYATLNRDFRKPFQEILYFRCGSLNHMMREEFYHSQYGDPEHHVSTRCHHIDYEDGVEYIEAEGEQIKPPQPEINAAHESFL